MTIDELFAHRVLEFTRAEAILNALVVDIDNMKSSLGSKLTSRDDTLAAALAMFRSGAVGQWLKGTALGESAIEYEQARNAVIGRARSLERRAYAAAEAAQALALVLEGTEPLITTDDLAWRIDRLAGKFYDGEYATDTAAEPDLTALWQDLTPSALIPAEAVENLRRYYDTRITGPYTGQNLPALYPLVTAWREHHLTAPGWDGDTWAYAVDTLRSWDEAATLWHALADDRRGDLTPAENVRLRTALAARVKEVADGNPGAPRELVEAVTEFDNAHMWLMMRIRAAETMADLKIVAVALLDRGRDADGALTLMRTLARRFDILTTTAPDADDDNEWSPANVLHNIVTNWRIDIYNAAMACTTAAGGRDYDEAARYTLLDCAIADARHTGQREHVANLLDRIARVAGAEHIITGEHIERLKAAAAQGDTTAIELNGGNHP